MSAPQLPYATVRRMVGNVEIISCAAHSHITPCGLCDGTKRCFAQRDGLYGSAPCNEEPAWAIYDNHQRRQADRYACDRHLPDAIDRDKGGLILNAVFH